MIKKPELLAPAGNLEKLKVAIRYGADAVYLGGSKLNLRAFAHNFDNDQLREGVKYAHDRGKKVYVTLNVIPHNGDFAGIEDYLKELYEIGVDAIIVADPGIIATAKEVVPDLELHLSTQANAVNIRTVKFWHSMGIKRVVPAREMSMQEIKDLIKEIPDTCEVESFVHGAMCMAYSGRCIISNYMTGRRSNSGACAQPCRYKYHLVEERRPGEYYEVKEDERGSYIMNSKDLCMIEHIPDLVEAGIDSFKIEGRMKSSYYVASVVKAYREAIDTYFEDPENYKFNEKWMEYLLKPSHRRYTTGFYYNDEDRQYYESSSYLRNFDIVGIVKSYDKETKIVTVEQRNRLFAGDKVEILRPKGECFEVTIEDMKNENGESIEVAPNAQMIFTFKCDEELEEDYMLVKGKEEN